MIEKLSEYLVRHGWPEGVADDIQDALNDDGMDAVVEAAEGYGEDELIQAVEDWMIEQIEVGEI